MKTKLFLACMVMTCIQINHAFSQDNESENQSPNVQNFTLGADFVTQYVWRGLPYSTSPNIQPTLSYTNNKGNFTIGSWSSYSLSKYYGEVDWFASYDFGPISLSAWDYFNMSEQTTNYYFDYKKRSTAHSVEGSIAYNGPESFPIGLSWSTFFYGYDQDSNGYYYYSSYFEASYLFKWKENNIKLFAGITPWEGLYADQFAVNNLGITNERNIKINDKFTIPISGSVILNPYKQNIFFVLSIGLYAND